MILKKAKSDKDFKHTGQKHLDLSNNKNLHRCQLERRVCLLYVKLELTLYYNNIYLLANNMTHVFAFLSYSDRFISFAA